MNLTMIGAGYVGLVTGACLADFGHVVTCIDTDAGRISALNEFSTSGRLRVTVATPPATSNRMVEKSMAKLVRYPW